jgi:oligopeptidase B
VRHGRSVVDEYAWLRDRDDPDTLAYLRAENDWADRWFAPLEALRETIVEELRTRVVEDDTSVPVVRGAFAYRERTERGREYPIWERWPVEVGESGAAVILDENREAEGHEFFAVGACVLSPSQDLLAWSRDVTGDEHYELWVRDLRTEADTADRITGTAPAVAWIDDEHLLYCRLDHAERPFQVWRHRLGTDPDADVLVHVEPDERFHLDLERTRSGAYVVVSAQSRTTSEVHLLRTDRPDGPLALVEPRRPGHEYAVDHWVGDDPAGCLVVLTNDAGAEDFAVMLAPVDEPGCGAWRTLVPHRPGRRILDVEAFAGHLVLSEWDGGLPSLRVIAADGTERRIEPDEPVGGVEPGPNPEWTSRTVRYEFESYRSPPCTIDLDLASGDRTVRKRMPVGGAYDPDAYRSERRWVTAADGARIPVDVVRHRDTPIDGTAPLVVHGYGAYEVALAPWFSHHRLSLYDRGVIGAFAHVRGGGEMGRRWYLEGRCRAKPNTFADTIAVVEDLVAAGYGAPGRVALWGGSAGGLLVGATVAQRPELFAAAVAEVPFVDVVNTLSDPTLPLTVNEWEEWGNPADPEDEAVLASYTPYENVRGVPYPAMLVTGGWHDPRVSFHEPAKWVARLRATVPDGGADPDRPILLVTELGAGHAGPSGRYGAWRDLARQLAFVLRALRVA